MKNPWMKRNPLMSMWMSGANTVLGSARSRATAEGKRQVAMLMADATSQTIRFWTGGAIAPSARRKKKSG